MRFVVPQGGQTTIESTAVVGCKHVWCADFAVGFDVITPPVVDMDAEPTTTPLARLIGANSSYDGKMIETSLEMWDGLVEPGFSAWCVVNPFYLEGNLPV